jgi:hypothetical protein
MHVKTETNSWSSGVKSSKYTFERSLLNWNQQKAIFCYLVSHDAWISFAVTQYDLFHD